MQGTGKMRLVCSKGSPVAVASWKGEAADRIGATGATGPWTPLPAKSTHSISELLHLRRYRPPCAELLHCCTSAPWLSSGCRHPARSLRSGMPECRPIARFFGRPEIVIGAGEWRLHSLSSIACGNVPPRSGVIGAAIVRRMQLVDGEVHQVGETSDASVRHPPGCLLKRGSASRRRVRAFRYQIGIQKLGMTLFIKGVAGDVLCFCAVVGAVNSAAQRAVLS